MTPLLIVPIEDSIFALFKEFVSFLFEEHAKIKARGIELFVEAYEMLTSNNSFP